MKAVHKMIDLHCDTIMKLVDSPEQGDLLHNAWKIDIEKLEKGEYALQDFALFVHLGRDGDPYKRYQAMLAVFNENIQKYSDRISHVRSYAELCEAEKSGRLSALLSIEEGGVLQGSKKILKQVYEDGVRLITISWNYPNELSFPQGMEYEGKGLTPTGKELVACMEELGIIVDCSHLNDKGTEDLLEICQKPFIASHSNARAITNHRRNLPDYLIKGIADKGGVIGLNFCYNFLVQLPDCRVPRSRLSDMVAHAKHIWNVGGSDALAIGTDFDGTSPNMEIEDASCMHRLYDALRENGFTSHQCDAAFSGNARRILKELL